MTERYRFQLGDRVTMTGTVVKEKTAGHVRGGRNYPERALATLAYVEGPVPVTHRNRTPVPEGIIVGRRIIRDHDLINRPGAQPMAAEPREGTSRRVWLVAWHMTRQPVQCLDHQVHLRSTP